MGVAAGLRETTCAESSKGTGPAWHLLAVTERDADSRTHGSTACEADVRCAAASHWADKPAIRGWCELELISASLFATIMDGGAVRYAIQLGLTSVSRAHVRASIRNQTDFDLVATIASAQPETVEPESPRKRRHPSNTNGRWEARRQATQ